MTPTPRAPGRAATGWPGSVAAAGLICALLAAVACEPTAAGAAAQRARSAEVRSRIVVTVPHEDTVLTVDGTTIIVSGQPRRFDSPALERGKTYRSTLTAVWRPNNYTVMTRSRTVEYVAGEPVVVDLTVEAPDDRAEIRFVPTPREVVSEMIRLAGIRAGDVAYEPGCGDARILIAAVGAGAARGVGIDIDPHRVVDARARVEGAGLDRVIEIRQGDALDVDDLSQASVVFLYMGEEFNRLLRPRLWRQLRPGSRVVSHRFTMGDWAPDRSSELTIDGEEYVVHLWTITDAIKQQVRDRIRFTFPAQAAATPGRPPRP